MLRILTLFASGVLSGLVASPTFALPIDRDTVAEYLEGTMTASIAKQDSDTIKVQMTTCRVRIPEKAKSVFLYQEQGLIEKPEQPYRQRFLEIKTTENNDDLVDSYSYKPNNLDRWVNFCDRNIAKRVVSQTQLGQLVCRVTLKPLLNVYLGQTPPEGCQASFRGAVKITNRIVLHQNGMDTWDRGFDESGNQIWGATDRAYQFRK